MRWFAAIVLVMLSGCGHTCRTDDCCGPLINRCTSKCVDDTPVEESLDLAACYSVCVDAYAKCREGDR